LGPQNDQYHAREFGVEASPGHWLEAVWANAACMVVFHFTHSGLSITKRSGKAAGDTRAKRKTGLPSDAGVSVRGASSTTPGVVVSVLAADTVRAWHAM